jgi:hypothetical protein
MLVANKMFLVVGPNKRRLHMSMQQVYSDDHMYDRAAPHLFGKQAALAVVQRDGNVRAVSIPSGVFIEWSAGWYVKVEDEAQLRLASRLVVAYHDNLRTESEMLSITENEWSQRETDLLEEAVCAHMEAQDLEDSESEEVEDYDAEEFIHGGKVGLNEW